MDALVESHSKLASLIGSTVEPVEVWRCAEEHRAYWRPERVRVILLAESHVYTNASDLERRVILPGMPGNDLPRGFVRLVYCLGYGENDLLDRPIFGAKDNPGTPHYWKIFYSCLNQIRSNADFAPVLKQTPLPQRIKNKLALLQGLKEAGVWLVDTSLAALYPKPDPIIIGACLRTSWDTYVGNVVEAARPSQIVCIGRGVAFALGNRLSDLKIPLTVVPQPNAKLTSDVHHETFQRCYEVVRQSLQDTGI